MRLAGLLTAALADPALAAARNLAARGGPAARQLDLTGPPAVRPFVVAAVAARRDGPADGEPGPGGPAAADGEPGQDGRPVLAVTATSREAEDLAEALGCLLPPEQVVVYPAWETLPHERLSPRSDTVGRRLDVRRRLAHPDPDDPQRGPVRVVVAPVRSMLQPQLVGLGDLVPVELRPGATADPQELAQTLTDLAYARV